MKFKVGQKVKVIQSGHVQSVIWIDVLGGRYYRLENGFLYTEEELEAVED
jgi:hypothetical protein